MKSILSNGKIDGIDYGEVEMKVMHLAALEDQLPNKWNVYTINIPKGFSIEGSWIKKASHEKMDTLGDFHRRCPHRWKKYVGFKEAYQFCEICPATKGIEE